MEPTDKFINYFNSLAADYHIIYYFRYFHKTEWDWRKVKDISNFKTRHTEYFFEGNIYPDNNDDNPFPFATIACSIPQIVKAHFKRSIPDQPEFVYLLKDICQNNADWLYDRLYEKGVENYGKTGRIPFTL